MLTIVQACAAPNCPGQVRYTRVRRLLDNYLVGRCDECGRKYRLFNGRPAHEPDRARPTGRSVVWRRSAASGLTGTKRTA
jgi:RNase P subunit RPR2